MCVRVRACCLAVTSPSLRIDHDGAGFVVFPAQHHADPRSVRARHVDDVGHFAGPVDEAAVDVDAEVVGLQAEVWAAHGAGHHRLALRRNRTAVR